MGRAENLSKEERFDEFPVLMNFARNVKYRREELGLTQPEFADLVDAYWTYVSKIENFRAVPRLSTVSAWSEAMGVPAALMLLEKPWSETQVVQGDRVYRWPRD